MIRFHHNGETYVYDFALLGVHRISRAITVYRWHHQQQDEASRKSIRDLKLSGGMDYQAEAMGHLLIRRVGEGYEAFDPTNDGPKEFFKSLPSEWWEQITKVEEDFFSNTGLRDTALVKQALGYLQALNPELLNQLIQGEQGKKVHSSNTSTDLPDYSTPANSDSD